MESDRKEKKERKKKLKSYIPSNADDLVDFVKSGNQSERFAMFTTNLNFLDMKGELKPAQGMECEEEGSHTYCNIQHQHEVAHLDNEDGDLMVVKPSTIEDRASVLGCVIVGLFMESKYPPAMYEKLFQCQKIQQIFVQMREEDRLLLMKMIDEYD